MCFGIDPAVRGRLRCCGVSWDLVPDLLVLVMMDGSVLPKPVLGNAQVNSVLVQFQYSDLDSCYVKE